jgi:alpha-amylase/alpha-mannosidase (GH57 family)
MLPKKRFRHPEDAQWHIKEAVKYHTEIFGQPPQGMWPSEGSVSDEALEIMASNNIRWVATDEDILFKSISPRRNLAGYAVPTARNPRGYTEPPPIDRRIIYQPYSLNLGSKSISVMFRDKNLSDIISFNYNAWNQSEAAQDLIVHFRNISEALRRENDRGIVTIAMDGENAWEYFEDNARIFFETLYANLDNNEELETTTISDYLEIEKPPKTLNKIFPASWINHDFRIWIGEEQDNLSWDYLSAVRADLVKFTKQLQMRPGNDEALERAWREFYISEGSDWNWWYGGKAHAGGNNPFDSLYRTHLKNIYKFLKKKVPDFLKIAIS